MTKQERCLSGKAERYKRQNLQDRRNEKENRQMMWMYTERTRGWTEKLLRSSFLLQWIQNTMVNIE